MREERRGKTGRDGNGRRKERESVGGNGKRGRMREQGRSPK